MAALSIYNRSA